MPTSTALSSFRLTSTTLLYLLGIGLALSLFAGEGLAQTTTMTTSNGMTPSGLTTGAPNGSYPLSGFDNINLFNGNLNFRLPLLTIAGRGNVGAASMLALNTKSWRVKHFHKEMPDGNEINSFSPTQQNCTGGDMGYNPGRMSGRRSGVFTSYSMSCGYRYNYVLTRFTFTLPDGTEYELRDQNNGGQPLQVAGYACSSGPSRGTVFVTADGTSATFISDAPVIENGTLTSGCNGVSASGYMLLADGTRYRIDTGLVSWIRDRNGNKITFTYDAFGRVTSMVDAINRQVTISYDYSDVAPYGLTDRIVFKGFGGAERIIRISKTPLGSALRPNSGFSVQTLQQLFPELNSSSPSITHNPTVVSKLWLPSADGTSQHHHFYQFFYNSYGELARVELPTGGAIEYDSTAGSGVIGPSDGPQIYRRVLERRVYVDGTTLDGKTTYSAVASSASDPKPWTTTVTADSLNSTGALMSRSKHYFNGSGMASLFQSYSAYVYTAWNEGREYQTEIIDKDNTSVVLRRVASLWQQRAPISWWNAWMPDPYGEPQNDPRLVEVVTTLEPQSANLVTKTSAINPSTGAVSFDQYNNQTDSWEYDYGVGAPGFLIRSTHNDFLQINPVNGVDYRTTSVHVRSLPIQTQIFDAVGIEKGRTTFEYDNYTNDGSHAPLTDRPGISGFDSSFSTSYVTRGNLTRVTNWILAAGTQLYSYSQFDIAGNVVKTIDPRGNATTLEYNDRFGAPDGDARSNVPPSELGGLTSYAFVTKMTNALGQTAYGQFDYYIGRPVNGEDANGIVAGGYFNDTLDRPTQVRRAVGTLAANQTSYSYDGVNRVITTTSDLNINNDNGLVSKAFYDGLGRTIETRHYEGSSNYIATQQQYDALGRTLKISNPFRPWQAESAVWTTSAFDSLGRIISMTTPDSAVLTTSYSGNTVTVSDQAGKSRKRVTDALGRTTSVYEDPNGLNYLTICTYDVLDNLTTVSQGVQTRTFVYDSLKRLISATNPESGTVTYGYDNNGNQASRVDARNITTTLTYDVLNRIVSKSYNDNPQTPTVNYFYDSQSLPTGAPSYDRGSATGRLVAITYGGGSAGNYRGYDAMGRVVRQYQRTDSINYLVEASYFANNAVQNLTHPSVPGAGDRRVVSYTNDAAGRLGSLNTNATSYSPAANISSVGYASHNAMKTETYGNNLVHAITYNNRLQPTEIKLGTSGAPTSVALLTYNFGTTNNNGNVQTAGYTGGGLSYTQTFGYDPLNRLTTSLESGSVWSQTNGHDRYGNRWIDLGGGSQSLYFNTANNRINGLSYDAAGNLLNDGVHGYDYDAENKVSKVDTVSAYVYDGEGQRVRKLVGENLRFIYDMSGREIAEFDGSTGALKKEYIYSASGLAATIEPTALNSNGTRYTTSDILSSPRIVTNSSGNVVSRHDYKPFGEELGAGIGGRNAGMGFGVADGMRQKFTQKERDNETGLDYFSARYYSSSQGRFTSADSVAGSAVNPQTLNLYAYVLNNPLKYVDPSGHFVQPRNIDPLDFIFGRNPSDDMLVSEQGQGNQQGQPQQQPQSQPQPQGQVIDLRNPTSTVINQTIADIQAGATPLRSGEVPKPTSLMYIPGELVILQNATLKLPDGRQITNVNGYMRLVAAVVLDQGCNVMIDQSLTIDETITPVSNDAKTLAAAGRLATSTGSMQDQQPNGAFIDIQLRVPGSRSYDIETKQDLTVRSGSKEVFKVDGIKLRHQDATKTITVTPGEITKIP
jgi:RHS repeat-associated protein